MVEIVSCPECGKPRALGHRCPSCGDAAPASDQQAPTPTPDSAQSWQQPTSPTGQTSPSGPTSPGGYSPAAPSTFSPATSTRRSSGGTGSHGRLVGWIAALAVIVVAIVVAVVLTRGGAEVVEGETQMAGAPGLASDLAAQQLIRNAMTTFDAVVVETGSYERIDSSTLQTMEPGINWVQGSAGVYASPPTGANAKQNTVAWAATGPLSYELGTYSTTGATVGVRVDKMGGGVTRYKDGQAGGW